MFRIIVVDDEDKIVKMICNFVSENIPEVEIVATANSAEDGIRLIEAYRPNLLLLDIEMPHANGFELLRALPNRNFDVVFITAYNQYGIEAIKANALDYILKPIDKDELVAAIRKSYDNSRSKNYNNLESLLKDLHRPKSNRIKIQTKTEIEYIDAEEISFVEADGNYSKIYFSNKTVKLVSTKLKHFQEQLIVGDFYRVHKSYIINLAKVLRYNTQEHIVVMLNGNEIPIARNKRQDFLEQMDVFLLNS